MSKNETLKLFTAAGVSRGQENGAPAEGRRNPAHLLRLRWRYPQEQALRRAANVTDLLYRVEQHRRALLAEHLAPRGLNFTQWIALRILCQRGPCSMTELAQGTAIDRTSLTRTVDVLTSKGLAARWTPPKDRRAVLVDATTDGKWLAEAVETEMEALERRLFVDLSADDQDRMAASLEKILARLPGRGGLADSAERAADPLTRRSRSA